VFAGLSTHLLPILQTLGLGAAMFVSIGALIGPAQVGARGFELLFRQRLSAHTIGLSATGLLAPGFLVPGLFGVRASTSTIFVRFERTDDHCAGDPAPRFIWPRSLWENDGKDCRGLPAMASAPLVFALIFDHQGSIAGLAVAACAGAISLVAMIALTAWSKTLPRQTA
jgi:hypothetical protein